MTRFRPRARAPNTKSAAPGAGNTRRAAGRPNSAAGELASIPHDKRLFDPCQGSLFDPSDDLKARIANCRRLIALHEGRAAKQRARLTELLAEQRAHFERIAAKLPRCPDDYPPPKRDPSTWIEHTMPRGDR